MSVPAFSTDRRRRHADQFRKPAGAEISEPTALGNRKNLHVSFERPKGY